MSTNSRVSTNSLLRSFAGGELTPELNGRIDLDKYQSGLALCRNAITLAHGPAARRPGFQFVNEAFDSTSPVRLIPFQFSATQSAVIELGDFYARIHIAGATLIEATLSIASISTSTVNTTLAHGYTTGDWVFIGSRFFKVTVVDSDTFTTADLWGVAATASGATAARVFTLDTPYAATDLAELTFAQSADVITLTHPAYEARELRRLSATTWDLVVIVFSAPTTAPSNVNVTATMPTATNPTIASYVVTAVQNDGVTESMPSAVATASNNLTLAGNFNTITWGGVAGATRYNVYKLRGGVYGYIGQIRPDTSAGVSITDITRVSYVTTVTTATAHGFTVSQVIYISATDVPSLNGTFQVATVINTTSVVLSPVYYYGYQYFGADASSSVGIASDTTTTALSIKDDNVLPDTTSVPPDDLITLNAEPGDYPACVTYHEQRRWFAGTDSKPQVLWATRTGTESNLTGSVPARDADALEIRIAANQYNRIRHLLALSDLIAFTAGGEFRIFADSAPAITPTSISIKPQGFAGASSVQPMVTAGSVLYVQAGGSRVRELAYRFEANAFATTDLTLFAPHRFNGFTVTQLAYQRLPDQILWAVRNDGVLLGLSYVPDQQVFGWHAHDTPGAFESICVVSEDNADVLYAVVARFINGRAVRYIERLTSRLFNALQDAVFVDSCLNYPAVASAPVEVLLELAFNGENLSTTFTDTSPYAHAVGRFGFEGLTTPCISTEQSVAGGASAKFHGFAEGVDYLTVTGGTEFDFLNAAAFVIECDFFVTASHQMTILARWGSAGDRGFQFRITPATGLYLIYSLNGTASVTNHWTFASSLSTWYHLRIEGTAGDIRAFIDGVEVGSVHTLTGAVHASTSDLTIGANVFQGFNGFLDNVLIFLGAGTPAVASVSGLWHLEGETVSILADGVVRAPQAVANGSVSLSPSASVVHAGLPYDTDLQTLPLSLERMPAWGAGSTKNISKVHLRISQTSEVMAGPAFDRLRTLPATTGGVIPLSIDPSWTQDAAVCIRQSAPLPLTLMSLALEVAPGG